MIGRDLYLLVVGALVGFLVSIELHLPPGPQMPAAIQAPCEARP